MGNKVVHSVETPAGSQPEQQDRVILGMLHDVANGAGGGAGQAVVVNVAMAGLPPNYSVQVTPNQDAVAYVTAKTSAGFTVTLNPRLATNTLAAGTFDVTVSA